MSSTALRAVRELRGDSAGGDGRPFTPRGERPGTASGGLQRAASPEEGSLSAAAADALRKELEETKLALEKEKRNTRSLDQWINELTETKDSEIREAVAEARLHQAALAKAEQHAASLEELYKGQVAKLTGVVERLQPRPASAAEAEESFSAVLREEMRVMQAAFTLKISKTAADHAARVADLSKQLRAAQESLAEERRNNASLVDKMSRAPASPSAAASASASFSAFPAAAAARPGSGAQPSSSPTAAGAAGAGKPGSTSASSSSRIGASSSTIAAKPLVKGATGTKIK